MSDKKQFSERLKAAMTAAGLEPRPAELEKLFNLHYWGTPVTYQGVRRWLLGLSVPEQDKLELVAELLGTDAIALRYGNRNDNKSKKKRAVAPVTSTGNITDINDRIAIEAFLRLPANGKSAVRQVIHALAEKS